MSNQKYKVISLSVGGLNNKIYRSGDIVEAGAFSAPIEKMVAEGWVEAIEPSKQATAAGPVVPDTESTGKPAEKARSAKKEK